MSVATDSILVIKERTTMSNIHRSSEVIENLRASNGFDSAYPMAFGYAWALLSEKNRLRVIEFAKKELAEFEEKKGN